MKLPIKTLVSFLSLAVLAFGMSSPAKASMYQSFLRLNKIYVLYTNPIVPHADSSGTFWVGLRPFATLIGATFQENWASQSVTLTYRKHTLTLREGTRQGILDGKAFQLTAAAKRIGAERQFIVPMLAITRAFDLHTRWNHKYHVLTLVDRNLYDEGSAAEWVSQIKQFEGPPLGYIQRVRTFTGPPYPLVPVVPVVMLLNGTHLDWRLRNVSAKDLPRMDINFLVSGQQGEEISKSGIPFPTAEPDPLPKNPLKARRTLDLSVSTSDAIIYVPHSSLSDPGHATITSEQHPVGSVVAWIVP